MHNQSRYQFFKLKNDKNYDKVLHKIGLTRPEKDVIDKEEEAELMEALAFGVVQVYNDKLKERCRRKRIIQEHGLINMRRHMATRYRYDAALTHRVCERLSPIAQLFKFQDYWKFIRN